MIRQGSRAVGEIARLVPKGAFGKSGKLDIELLYVDTGDARIRLSGRAANRGESGTTNVVVTAVLAGAFSAFVTGRSADLPSGSPMVGFVDYDVPLLVRPVP